MERVRFTWQGDDALRQVRSAAATGIQKGAEHWLGESQKVVPIEEGTLERSGVASVDRAKLTGAVSFDTPYAVTQHEDESLRHDAGRTAKFVERPGLREAAAMLQIVATHIRRTTT